LELFSNESRASFSASFSDSSLFRARFGAS
jgi:hypothetical protein